MPKLVLNGIEYSGNMTIQYNNPAIYSTDEREIGVWTDGKPLYQRTIYINSLPDTSAVDYPHNISNIDKICSVGGLWISNAGSYGPLPNVDGNDGYYNNIMIYTNNTNIKITSRRDLSLYVAYVTLQYTKTTDTTGSGTWGTNGCFTEHYSTSEQIIGTWIDGRPIYQRTYNLPSYTEGVNNFIEHGVTNLDMVIKLFGTCKRGNKRIALPFFHQTTDDWSINVYDADASTGKITFWAGANNAQNITDIYVTMQYTKSTS